tara:strand:- start:2960 stop:3205 length:246 start_codon:yes stop_codon:yes gene_type:complete
MSVEYKCKKSCSMKDVEGGSDSDQILIEEGKRYYASHQTFGDIYELSLENTFYSLSFRDDFFDYFYTEQETREMEIDKVLL